MQSLEPMLVDVKTACAMLSIKRTKLFSLLNHPENGLQRRKIGSKTLVTLDSIKALANGGTV